MYNKEDLIQLSALQHYAFCPIMHDHVHDEGDESRGDVRIERGASLRSLRLGLIGKANVVEYHRNTGNACKQQ